MSNTDNEQKEKRKRISRRYQLEGEIVAKSYVKNFHKRTRITQQLVVYNSLSYRILERKIVLIEENARLV